MQLYQSSSLSHSNLARQKHVVVIAAIYAFAYLVLELLTRLTPLVSKSFFDIYRTIPPFLAAGWGLNLAHKNARQGSNSRQSTGWFLISLGCLVWGLAQALVTYYIVCLRADVPSPGPPDAFFMLSYGFICTGIVLLFGSLPLTGRVRLLLDATITTSSIAMASWYFIVERLWHQSGTTIPQKLVGVSYPLADIVILFFSFMLVTAAKGNEALRRSISCVAFGMLMMTVADTGFIQYSFSGGREAGLWPDSIWAFSWFVIGFAFLLQMDADKADASVGAPEEKEKLSDSAAVIERPRSLVILLMPYTAAFLVCVALIANDYVIYNRPRISTFAATYVVIALVVIRQVFTLIDNQRLNRDLESRLKENRHLTQELQAFNDGLEQVVERRAKQLGALHHLTRAVHTTQQMDAVLSAAVSQTAAALHGVTASVWLREHSGHAGMPPYGLSSFEAISPSPVIERFVHCFTPSESDAAALIKIADERRAGDESDSEEPVLFGEMLCSPLRFRGELLGIVGVTRTVPATKDGVQSSAFDQSDRDLLDSIGMEVATALHHARQFAAARDAADRDPVTNLYNHRAIHQRLDEELCTAKSEHQPLSIMMMDLNDFKLFNDTYGHPVGDQVLRHVAKSLLEESSEAICGRYGGDEFLVLIPRTTPPQARDFAERLRQRLITVGFRSPNAENGAALPIAISFGVALYPQDSVNRQDLLTLADANLYKAKRSETGIGVTNSTQRVNHRLRVESSFGILDAMVTSIDNKDKYTRQHSEDVAKYALWLAQELCLSDETMRLIRVGALLHDVGKIGIPEEILRKPGHLTADEYDAVCQHPSLGALIVGAIPGMEGIVDAVRSHHERWDGKGYPDRLAGTDIPMIGRIMAVADAFSAMTTNRPYRAGMIWQAALSEIQNNIGKQFDPLMARAFCSVVKWRMGIEDEQPEIAEYEGESELPLAA